MRCSAPVWYSCSDGVCVCRVREGPFLDYYSLLCRGRKNPSVIHVEVETS